MADMNNPHFGKIFWYIMTTTLISFGYLVMVTLKAIPEKNQHTVDFAVGFLLGTVISSGAGYLLGGNPNTPTKKTSVLPEDSETTITATTTSTNNQNEPS